MVVPPFAFPSSSIGARPRFPKRRSSPAGGTFGRPAPRAGDEGPGAGWPPPLPAAARVRAPWKAQRGRTPPRGRVGDDGSRALPGTAGLRLRGRAEPPGPPGGRLRGPDDRPVPAVPPGLRRPGPGLGPRPAAGRVPRPARPGFRSARPGVLRPGAPLVGRPGEVVPLVAEPAADPDHALHPADRAQQARDVGP